MPGILSEILEHQEDWQLPLPLLNGIAIRRHQVFALIADTGAIANRTTIRLFVFARGQ
jgi:hypothetical protein